MRIEGRPRVGPPERAGLEGGTQLELKTQHNTRPDSAQNWWRSTLA